MKMIGACDDGGRAKEEPRYFFVIASMSLRSTCRKESKRAQAKRDREWEKQQKRVTTGSSLISPQKGRHEARERVTNQQSYNNKEEYPKQRHQHTISSAKTTPIPRASTMTNTKQQATKEQGRWEIANEREMRKEERPKRETKKKKNNKKEEKSKTNYTKNKA